MTIRRARLTLVLLLVAAPSLAALDKYKDWEKSPEYAYLATDEEKKEWKKIASDQEAEKFIALFWARRDPELKTPENEFRERFEALVKKADELFALGRRRGALTERGKALILIGPPKSIAQKADSSASTPLGGYRAARGRRPAPGWMDGNAGATAIITQFLYEKPQLPPWADIQSLDLQIPGGSGLGIEHFVEGMGPAKRLETKAAQMADRESAAQGPAGLQDERAGRRRAESGRRQGRRGVARGPRCRKGLGRRSKVSRRSRSERSRCCPFRIATARRA